MRKALPLHGLRAFEATARHMSFQKAADELHVTSTAISHQIRQLEDFLGTSLFKRRPRPITLTDTGAHLFPAVRDALDALDTAVSAVRPPHNREQLTVSTTNAFATHWLLPRLNRFHELHPDLAINVHAGEAVVDLSKGDIDCAIRYTDVLPEDFVCRALFRDQFLPVCAPSLLPDRQPFNDLGTLCQRRRLHFEWKHRSRRNPTWERWFDDVADNLSLPAECNPDEGTRFSEETLAIQAAIQGQGIALCSTLMTADYLANHQLAQAFDFGLPGYLSVLVFPPIARKRESIRLFSDWLLAEAAQFRAEQPEHFFSDDTSHHPPELSSS
jgi:LysR family glycine cleavage system transcriptional activator